MLSRQEHYESASKGDSAPRLRKPAAVLISLVILGVLTIQVAVSFCCRDEPASLPSLGSVQSGVGLLAYKVLTPPSSWPFLDYPMYKTAYFEGSEIPIYRVVGILPDSTEVSIGKDDLGVTSFRFRTLVVNSLREEDTQTIEAWVGIYESKYNRGLVGVRLENHPLIISKNGANAGPVQIVKELGFQSVQE